MGRVLRSDAFLAPAMKKPTRTPWWSWAAGALAVAGAIGIGLYLARSGEEGVTRALPPAAPSVPNFAAAPIAPPIQHPIEQAAGAVAQANAVPALLPPLDESDVAVASAFAEMFGAEGLMALLNPQHVVQRIVATIDSLPRQKLALESLPVRTAQGSFATTVAGAQREIDERNAARYAPYIAVAKAVDAKALVAWYVRFYPLFQEAYRQLGYPDGYFNDRLVAVIDHLLQTPDINLPIALEQPNVLYEYADPALESRSAGQKLLMRSGAANEAAIKAKLREIRAALTEREPPGA